MCFRFPSLKCQFTIKFYSNHDLYASIQLRQISGGDIGGGAGLTPLSVGYAVLRTRLELQQTPPTAAAVTLSKQRPLPSLRITRRTSPITCSVLPPALR